MRFPTSPRSQYGGVRGPRAPGTGARGMGNRTGRKKLANRPLGETAERKCLIPGSAVAVANADPPEMFV